MEKGTHSDCIIVFMRAPQLGRVKSRLAEAVGRQSALELYCCFIKDILTTAEATGRDICIFFNPPDARNQIISALDRSHATFPQQGADLGERMAAAFKQIFKAGYSRSILIGTDCPEMTPAVLLEAFSGIQKNGSTIGPSQDGGYYLIGFGKDGFSEHVFERIIWGTETVCFQTLEKFRQTGATPHSLPELNDIDTLEDLRGYFIRYKKAKPPSKTMQYLIRSDLFETLHPEESF